MKLETSVELLERVREVQGVSWWKLQQVLDASESTVKNWKRGRTTIDKKFATRIAEIIHEPPEYVLACLEAEREQSEEVLKLWRRIAERFRSTTASILLAGVVVGLSALPVQQVRAAEQSACAYDVYYVNRRRHGAGGLTRCLKTMVRLPLRFATWTRAWISSTVFPLSCSQPLLVYT